MRSSFRAGVTVVASALFASSTVLFTGAATASAGEADTPEPVAPTEVVGGGASPAGSGWQVQLGGSPGPWLAVGDVDGDGRQDVVRLRSADGAAVWFGRADRGQDRVAIDPPAGTDAVTAIDVDGDGTDELLWWTEAGGPAALWTATSSGARSWRSAGYDQAPAGTRPWVLDVDGDGRADVLWHGRSGVDALDRGRSGGGFDREDFGALGELAPQVGDFDDDGYDDVLWYDPAGGAGAMWWGGEAISAAPFDIGTGMVLHPGQWDGEGALDILVGGANGNVTLLGQPSRHFAAEIVPPSVVAEAVVGDVNGDRSSDLVELTGQIGVWNNDNSGWRWEPWPSPAVPVGVLGHGGWNVLSVDVDGDGTDEVLAVPTDPADTSAPADHVWVPGYRREEIYQEANPYAPGGVIVRMLGITPGRRMDVPISMVQDACGATWPVHAAIAGQVQALLSDAASINLGICINSSYRSYDEQVAVRKRVCAAGGFAGDEGCIYQWRSGVYPFLGGNQVARPGYSRHQLGVAIDVGDLDGYATWPVTSWLSANAHRYGLYNLGDRQRLGPAFNWGEGGEPWHISIDGR